MKKLILALTTLALAVAMSMVVTAGEPAHTGEPLPPGSVQHQAWELINTAWVPMSLTDPAANARAWSSGPLQGNCNKIAWVIPVTVHASVAQWVDWSISGTRYDWRVRKPGTYAANSLTAWIKSNGAIEIDFAGFGNLAGPGGEIETWYAYGEAVNPGGLSWVPGPALTSCTIPDSGDIHAGLSWKLWNKINVVPCNSACEYNDDAIITLVVQNQKCWIDPETGLFAD